MESLLCVVLCVYTTYTFILIIYLHIFCISVCLCVRVCVYIRMCHLLSLDCYPIDFPIGYFSTLNSSIRAVLSS